MNRLPILLVVLIASAITLFAEPNPNIKNRNLAADVEGESSGIFTGDFLMPSLEEMLGEPVDNFGQYVDNQEIKDDLVAYAKKYLGCRYVHGGKGPNVFDCSGFTSYVFRNFGLALSPASRMQGTQGSRVSISDAQVGDLMFFSGRRGGSTVGHVGMVIDVNEETGQLKFIHASTSKGVTIQSFPDGAYYSKHFLHVQRVLPEEFEEFNEEM